MKTEHSTIALTDHELFDALIHHRRTYIQNANVDYDTLHHLTVSFLPPAELLEAYYADFADMNENMTYGENFTFEEMITDLKRLQAFVRLKHEYKSLDEIIEIASKQIMTDKFFDGKREEGVLLTTVVSFLSDPYSPPSTANKSVVYEVQFKVLNGTLHFENIQINSA